MAVFIATLAIANPFLPADRAVTRDMIGHDFLPFYVAGSMARQGQFANLYDLSAIKAAESNVGHAAGWSTGFGPWWNPPLAAWLFAPFTLLPFSRALILWQCVSVACLFASIALLSHFLPNGRNWKTWGLIALLILDSNPLWAVFTHAQNTCLTLLLLTITVTLWRSRRGVAAGAVAALLLYKPQHAVVIALALTASLGLPAAAGFAATAGALAVLTILTMPGAMSDYLHKLPRLVVVMQELSPYAWDRHVTLKAFWRLLFQGTSAGPTRWFTAAFWWTSELTVIGFLAQIALQARRNPARTDRLIAATIVAGPLLVPFFFDYDLLILAIPAVLCAAAPIDRRVLRAWMILFVALHLSTHLARPTHIVLATPALFALVVTLWKSRPATVELAVAPVPAPIALAA
jgi:alpha-1,2-mannosyltransferase